MSTKQQERFTINVGPLTGLSSLSRHTAASLRQFSRLFLEGGAPEVQWDLTNVEPRKMNMASLTCFLALAHRVRQFTGKASLARAAWNPNVFAFWNDISFLKIARQHDLFDWVPHNVLGGFEPGKTNPNTQILCIPYSSDRVPPQVAVEAWTTWKDCQRQSFKEQLELYCGHLFRPKRDVVAFDRKIGDQIALTTAELALNSLLWGRTSAFVGMQRSPRGITVCVCDCGGGLLETLRAKKNWPGGCPISTHLEAVVAASLVNVRELGLRRAIDVVTSNDGWVEVSSFDSHVHWKSDSWNKAKSRIILEQGRLSSIREVTPFLADYHHNINQVGLRGVRITFEISIMPRA